VDLEARLDELAPAAVAFAAELVRRPSPNPPGDTRAVAALVGELLAAHGVDRFEVGDRPHLPNLIASVAGRAPGPHLVLNGHMDTYPPGDEAAWSRPPFAGELHDGRLHGRGAGDMKSGLAALLHAFLALVADRPFRGRLSIAVVSDEMSFSPHGAPLVLERHPELVGDAAIGAEPTSPDFVLFGEKGMVWIELRTTGEGGAAAFAPGRRNAIESMAALIADLGRFRDSAAAMPEEVAAALAAGGGTAGLPPEALTYADDRLLPLQTLNVGTIAGGRKINLVADECDATVDLRLPPGVRVADVRAFLDDTGARPAGARYTVTLALEPNWSPPADPLFAALLDAGEDVLGRRPRLELGITASDTRLWRARGVPAANIGPRIAGQGEPNESIAARDIADCMRIVARAAAR
jgi:succinyl-diaminopimelate desuccinylase